MEGKGFGCLQSPRMTVVQAGSLHPCLSLISVTLSVSSDAMPSALSSLNCRLIISTVPGNKLYSSQIQLNLGWDNMSPVFPVCSDSRKVLLNSLFFWFFLAHPGELLSLWFNLYLRGSHIFENVHRFELLHNLLNNASYFGMALELSFPMDFLSPWKNDLSNYSGSLR